MNFYPLSPHDPLLCHFSPPLKINSINLVLARNSYHSVGVRNSRSRSPIHKYGREGEILSRSSPTLFNWRSGDPWSDKKTQKVFAVGYENRKLSCADRRERAKFHGSPILACVCVCVWIARFPVNGVCALGQGKPASLLIFRTSCERFLENLFVWIGYLC